MNLITEKVRNFIKGIFCKHEVKRFLKMDNSSSSVYLRNSSISSHFSFELHECESCKKRFKKSMKPLDVTVRLHDRDGGTAYEFSRESIDRRVYRDQK